MTTFNMSDFSMAQFPNGEWGVRLIQPDRKIMGGVELNFLFPNPKEPDIMLLVMMCELLSNEYGRVTRIHMPYIPYLRQDRSFGQGAPAVATRIIDILEKLAVFPIDTLTPHSNQERFSCWHLFQRCTIIDDNFADADLVSPDESAKLHCPHPTQLVFEKNRQEGWLTLQIAEDKRAHKQTNIDAKPPRTKAVIVDDLCDGGATFIACAEKLREMGYTTITLVVAHGFFSQGVEHLLENGIDKIITSNSVCRLSPITDKLRIFDCFTYAEIENA